MDGVEEAAREIAGLRSHVLSSPPRLAVMLLLTARGPMEFNDLRKSLDLTSGNLWSHLKRLEREGFVRLGYRFSFSGPRLVVEPTDKGVEETIRYVSVLRRVVASGALG